jgi:hypothetical protein
LKRKYAQLERTTRKEERAPINRLSKVAMPTQKQITKTLNPMTDEVARSLYFVIFVDSISSSRPDARGNPLRIKRDPKTKENKEIWTKSKAMPLCYNH